MDKSENQDLDDESNQGFKFDNDLEEYSTSKLNELSDEELVNYLYSFTKKDLVRILYYYLNTKNNTNQRSLTISVSEEIRDTEVGNKNLGEREEINEIIKNIENKSDKLSENNRPPVEDLINKRNNQIMEEEIDYDKIGSLEDREDTDLPVINDEKSHKEIKKNNHKDRIVSRELDLDKHKKVLISCLSENDLKYRLLLDIIDDNNANNLLMIRYSRISDKKLIKLSEELGNVRLITIGFEQKVPETVDNIIINNPNDIRRIGIIATDEIKSMNGQTIITYDSLDVLTQYVSIKSAFKFLHTFLGRLSKSNNTILLSVNNDSMEKTKLNTVKPLFDRFIDLENNEI